MQRGIRRAIVGAAIGVALAGCLAGCSPEPATSNASAVALGARALNYTSNGAVDGWASTTSCPSNLQPDLQASLPAGSTVTTEDPQKVYGPSAAPQLTKHDVATCAFSVVTNGHTLTQLYFFGMDVDTTTVIRSDLQTVGFTPGAVVQITGGTRQTYTGNGGSVAVSQLTDNGQSIVIVTG